MEYRNLNLICTHCGKSIESRPDFTASIAVCGFEPMEHRHIHNQKAECFVTTRGVASSYSDMNLRDAYFNQSFGNEE